MGTSNRSLAKLRGQSDKRGNSVDRYKRKLWMLKTFGDGTVCKCNWCDKLLELHTIQADRFPLAGKDGGSYRRSNIVPSCGPCNVKRGNL